MEFTDYAFIPPLLNSFVWVVLLYVAGALQDVLHLHDVLARVALARLCYTISRARALDGWCLQKL